MLYYTCISAYLVLVVGECWLSRGAKQPPLSLLPVPPPQHVLTAGQQAVRDRGHVEDIW